MPESFAAPVQQTFPTQRAFEAFAAQFARALQPGDVVALSGELGSGKTTFVRAAVRARHGEDQTTSPTFTFWHRYPGEPADRSSRSVSRRRAQKNSTNSDWKRPLTGVRLRSSSGGRARRRCCRSAATRVRIAGAGELPRTVEVRAPDDRARARRRARRVFEPPSSRDGDVARNAGRWLGTLRSKLASVPWQPASPRRAARAGAARPARRRRRTGRLYRPAHHDRLREIASTGVGTPARAGLVLRCARVGARSSARALCVVVGRTGVISARYRAPAGTARASGRIDEVLAEVLGSARAGQPRSRRRAGGRSQSARRRRVGRWNPFRRSMRPPAAAIALLGASMPAAASVHEVRADYGELPAAKVPRLK